MWFAAHIIEVFRVRAGEQAEFSVWENIVLVEANNDEEAWHKAEELGGLSCLTDDLSLTWNNRPSRHDFAGVRKVVACLDREERPTHGAEVSYNSLTFASEIELQRFVDGEEVSATYNDEGPFSLEE